MKHLFAILALVGAVMLGSPAWAQVQAPDPTAAVLAAPAAAAPDAAAPVAAPVPNKGDTIDHVLISDGLRVRRYHALAEHFDGRLASDHFPVIADLFFTPVGKGCG